MRAIASDSAQPQTFEPRADRLADYERFLAVTGLTEHLTIPAAMKEPIP